VLRIDETSKTLVAPQAGGLVTEAAPEREELLSLVGASWEAFAQELGLPNLKFVASEPVAGVDILAFDEVARKTVVVQVTGETVEWQLARALQAAAAIAELDAAALGSMHPTAAPGDSPKLVLVAGGYDPRALATIQWLGRHGVDISTFAVSVMRFGNERLLSVRPEPRDSQAADPASEVEWMLTGSPAPTAAPSLPAAQAANSAPPPGN
jgi:hypothetical protein